MTAPIYTPASYYAMAAPVLAAMEPCGVGSPTFALALGCATAAQETQLGRLGRRQEDGPAIDLYQLEPATAANLWPYAQGRFGSALTTIGIVMPASLDAALQLAIADDQFATWLMRAYYWRVPASLPNLVTFGNLWNWYKTFWNTAAGAATAVEFSDNLAAFTDLPSTV